MCYTKDFWLNKFREIALKAIELNKSTDQKKKASDINVSIKSCYDEELVFLQKDALKLKWDNEQIISEIMLMTYCSYVVMLETRNSVWPYDYMAFARRIGELWEPFCKLAFTYPIKPLKIITPPNFDDVQNTIKKSAINFIDSINVNDDIKGELKKLYKIPWRLVDSGGIQLNLDLHFSQDGFHYNCDFKSGFSSNEKGNTNRLLLVASIYRFIGKNEKTLLFVRQKEDENNHYLQTLKNSRYWDVYCSDKCYEAIKEFTGVDIRSWLDSNIDWEKDISPTFFKHLKKHELTKYLTW